MGLSMTIGNFAGFIAPIAMGAITDENVRFKMCFLGICVEDQSFSKRMRLGDKSSFWLQEFTLAATLSLYYSGLALCSIGITLKKKSPRIRKGKLRGKCCH